MNVWMCVTVVANGFVVKMIAATIAGVQMQINVFNDDLYDVLPPLYGL